MEDGHSNAGSKDYLVSLMFSHYDLNNNGLLEAQELSKVHIDPPAFFPPFFLSPFHSWHYSNDTRQGSRFPKQLRDD